MKKVSLPVTRCIPDGPTQDFSPVSRVRGQQELLEHRIHLYFNLGTNKNVVFD